MNTLLPAGLDVLIVDDDLELRESYPRWFGAVEAACTVVPTLKEARGALKRATWDALVIEERLPDGDAHEGLLADPGLALPRAIVAISASFTAATEIAAQAVGAVVLHKPFAAHDLLRAMDLASARRFRARPRDSGALALAATGKWRISPDGTRLEGAELSLDLTPRECEIILALWENDGVWVSTRALAARVLGREDVASLDTIRSHVRYLRDKLRPHCNLLSSGRYRGYRWVG